MPTKNEKSHVIFVHIADISFLILLLGLISITFDTFGITHLLNLSLFYSIKRFKIMHSNLIELYD